MDLEIIPHYKSTMIIISLTPKQASALFIKTGKAISLLELHKKNPTEMILKPG
jgi:hypothetical protein